MEIGTFLIVFGTYIILITIQVLLVRIDDKADLIMKDLGIEYKSNIRKLINKLKRRKKCVKKIQK
jgi:hypothetical protein